MRQLAIYSVPPLLAGWSIALVPSGSAGVRQPVLNASVTLYREYTGPSRLSGGGLYSTRDGLFSTVTAEESKKPPPMRRTRLTQCACKRAKA